MQFQKDLSGIRGLSEEIKEIGFRALQKLSMVSGNFRDYEENLRGSQEVSVDYRKGC